MPLIKVIRHGFTFFEAQAAPIAPLEDLPAADIDRTYPDQAPKGSRKAERDAEAAERIARGKAQRAAWRKQREERERIEEWSQPANIPNDIAEIQETTMEVFGINKPGQFFGPSRKPPLAEARITSMALCRELTPNTLQKIGAMHNRDHGTVVHALRSIEEKRHENAEFRAKIEAIEAKLRKEAA